RDTLENVALAAAQLDATGHVVYCNPHLAGMLGRPASQVVGLDWFADIVPPERAWTREAFERTMSGGLQLPHHEHQVVTAPGKRRATVAGATARPAGAR